MTGILLYRCPKLSGTPRITEVQCGHNHQKAAKSDAKPFIRNVTNKNVAFRNPETEDLIWLKPCVGCLGVKSIAKEPGAEQPVKFTSPKRVAVKRIRSRRRRFVMGDMNG